MKCPSDSGSCGKAALSSVDIVILTSGLSLLMRAAVSGCKRLLASAILIPSLKLFNMTFISEILGRSGRRLVVTNFLTNCNAP